VAPLFGFVQFEFAGSLGLPDGRYLARGQGGTHDQHVLVVEILGAPPPIPRRRRRQRAEQREAEPAPLQLTRVTAVLAAEPFESTAEAERWLEDSLATEEHTEARLAEGLGLVNRALHARAVAGADPHIAETGVERAVLARIGYGSGEEVAAGRFTAARHVDARGGPRSRRRRREEELRPQERVAAVLAGREGVDACETLLLRARADLDAGRRREAALQLRVALEAMLVELSGALADPRHEEDMATLETRRSEASQAANLALRGDLDDERERCVHELIEIAERVLRRRRVLRG